jgi:NitT/TauT family transport system permease protein
LRPLAPTPKNKRLVANAVTVMFLIAWAAYATVVPSYKVPGPWLVLTKIGAFLTNRFDLQQLGLSVFHVAAAIVISFVLGTLLAFAAHYIPVLRPLIYERMTPFMNSFSGIGWALIAVLWFGVNDGTVIFAISAVLLPFAVVNMREGLEHLDGELLEMARSFDRGGWRSFMLVTLPLLFPFMVITLRVSFGVSWKVTLTAELLGGSSGLGYLVNTARQAYNSSLIFAAIALIVAIVYGTDQYVLRSLERHVVRRDHAG